MRFSLLVIVAIILLRCFVGNADSAWNWNSSTMSTHADITGDGKAETIRLEKFVDKKEDDRFSRSYLRLTVNGQSIYDGRADVRAVKGFRLVNIDKRDKRKEISVMSPYLEQEWNGDFIYWFDGKSIHRVNDRPIRGTFHGDGRVTYAAGDGPPFIQETYRLQANHTLQLVIQKYYHVNKRAIVKDPFPIYSRPGLKRIVMLRAGTRVRILKRDAENWFYLRTAGGVRGWMNTRWNNQYAAFGWAAAD